MLGEDKEWEKSWVIEIGTNVEVDECVEVLRSQFELSDGQIAKILREKASELCPRKAKKVVVVTGVDLVKFIEKNIVAVCSKCGREGTKKKPLMVIGDDEERVSVCCHAKIKLKKKVKP
jgi:hypothetical protein